jgi:phospholipid/cholesterol/gamma-HCH transport system ATP-binding protein
MPDKLDNSPGGHALCVEDLTLGYGEKIILENVNFCVNPGEIVTILGGSGCGKSTLLKAMIGLLPPMRGSVYLRGEKISGEGTRESLIRARRKIGVLFQSGAMIGSLTIAENIALPIQEFSNAPAQIIDDIIRLKLEMVRLGGNGDYLPAELSGGMRKRAGLARAMALDPEILFCDEPSSGLDPVISAEMDQLLIELNESLGITMVVITHDLPSIRTISNWSIMLDREARGIIAVGPPEDLENSRDPRVSGFFRRQPPKH